jgi:hypothetical protein
LIIAIANVAAFASFPASASIAPWNCFADQARQPLRSTRARNDPER